MSVSRGAVNVIRICSGCRNEPAEPGQRYGRKCLNEAQRKSYHKKMNRLAELEAMFQLKQTIDRAAS